MPLSDLPFVQRDLSAADTLPALIRLTLAEARRFSGAKDSSLILFDWNVTQLRETRFDSQGVAQVEPEEEALRSVCDTAVRSKSLQYLHGNESDAYDAVIIPLTADSTLRPSELSSRLSGAIILRHSPARSLGDPDTSFALTMLGMHAAVCLENVLIREVFSTVCDHLRDHDHVLTNLPNRRRFRRDLEQAVAAAEPGGRFTVLFLDLDDFERINRTYGHDAGDVVLIGVAQRLCEFCETHPGQAARLGGDEFGLLLRETESPVRSARELLALLGKPIPVAGVEHRVRASVGLANFPADANSADGLIRSAEQAMYRAKDRGGNQVCDNSEPTPKP